MQLNSRRGSWRTAYAGLSGWHGLATSRDHGTTAAGRAELHPLDNEINLPFRYAPRACKFPRRV